MVADVDSVLVEGDGDRDEVGFEEDLEGAIVADDGQCPVERVNWVMRQLEVREVAEVEDKGAWGALVAGMVEMQAFAQGARSSVSVCKIGHLQLNYGYDS